MIVAGLRGRHLKNKFNGMCIKECFKKLAIRNNGTMIIEEDAGIISTLEDKTIELRVTIQLERKLAYEQVAKEAGMKVPDVVRIILSRGEKDIAQNGMIKEER